MYNVVKHPYLRGRLLATKSTKASSTFTFGRGQNDAAWAANGTGVHQATLDDVPSRVPVAVAGIDDDIADGGYAALNADPTKLVVELAGLGAGGSGDDGTLHSFILGHFLEDNTRMPSNSFQRLLTSRPGCALIPFKVQGTSTAQILIGSQDATLVDNGTGDYTLTLKRGRAGDIVAAGTLIGSAGGIKVVAPSNDTINVQTFDAAGSAADRNFYLFVFVTDTDQDIGRGFHELVAPHRKPRLECFHLTITGGTPTLTVGDSGTDVTDPNSGITDNGAGDYSIAYRDGFAREPVVIAIANNRVHVHSSSDKDTLRLLTTDASGSGAEATDVHVLALGWDDADEYYQGD